MTEWSVNLLQADSIPLFWKKKYFRYKIDDLF